VTRIALAGDLARLHTGAPDGHSWPDIGAALGLAPAAGDGRSAAEAAYDQVTGEPGFRTRAFAWVCPACHGTVLDRGPEAGRPEDCEEGHAKGCPRLAAAVTAWEPSGVKRTSGDSQEALRVTSRHEEGLAQAAPGCAVEATSSRR
jgi:hypothetical protein